MREMSGHVCSHSSGSVDTGRVFIGHARETRLSSHYPLVLLSIPPPPCSWVGLGCSKDTETPKACLSSHLSIWKDTPCSVRMWRLKGGMWDCIR